MGKEDLLNTIIHSTIMKHSPEEINFYIIDCGAETLKMFYKMPHVGAVATVGINIYNNIISKEEISY